MARKIDIDQGILEQALLAVEQETGLRLRVENKKIPAKNGVDAFVRIEGEQRLVTVVVKKWAQQANLGALVHQIKQLPEQGMLVADFVNPKMAEKLRAECVQFIDTAGNAFINMPPIYVYVTGKRRQTPEHMPRFMPGKEEVKRAFEPTGLKVIFAFLCQPELVNAAYREIAEKADVAVGTVAWVIKGLKAADFIRERTGMAAGKPARKPVKNQRRLVNYQKLLTRWIEAYPEKLRPKQVIGEFIADNPHWWKEIDIQKYQGHWGGEIAATKYTGYLKPQVATVYLPDTGLTRLLRDARLRKATEWGGDKAGGVIIYRPFWPENRLETGVVTGIDEDFAQGTEKYKELVHPILAYADLVASGDARNMETAQRLYDEHITQYFRED